MIITYLDGSAWLDFMDFDPVSGTIDFSTEEQQVFDITHSFDQTSFLVNSGMIYGTVGYDDTFDDILFVKN